MVESPQVNVEESKDMLTGSAVARMQMQDNLSLQELNVQPDDSVVGLQSIGDVIKRSASALGCERSEFAMLNAQQKTMQENAQFMSVTKSFLE